MQYKIQLFSSYIIIFSNTISVKSEISLLYFKLKFIPTEFYTSKSGTIFVSSNEGDIYSVILSINEVTGKVESKIKNLTRNKFLQLFPPILLLRSQIIQIAVDEETQILAALNKKSIIKFYKIAEDKMELVFEFNPRDFEYLQQFLTNYARL